MVASAAPAASAIMTGVAQTSLKGEDLWKTHMQAIGGDMVSFAIVADGHGEAQAAHSSAVNGLFPTLLRKRMEMHRLHPCVRPVGAAFERVHKEVRAAGATDVSFPGRQLTVCMINVARNELTTLHVGDSEAILVPHEREDALPQRLTAEHRLQDSRPEQKRVVNLGARSAGYSTPRQSCRPGRCASSPAAWRAREGLATPTRATS